MNANKTRVLVAEDNLILSEIMRVNLQRAGFDVVTVGNGGAAVEELRKEHFDLLITDFQMPGLCGEGLCRAARHELSLTELAILVCSAKGLEIDLRQLQTAYRVDGLIYKPFSVREVISVARNITAAKPLAGTL